MLVRRILTVALLGLLMHPLLVGAPCAAEPNPELSITVQQPYSCSGILVTPEAPNKSQKVVLEASSNRDDTLHPFEVIATNTRHSFSRSSEVWLYGVSDKSGPWPLEKVRRSLQGDWIEQPQPNAPLGIVFLSIGKAPSSIAGVAQGELNLELLSHPWSGQVQTKFDDLYQSFDLYSTQPERITVRLTRCSQDTTLIHRSYTFRYPLGARDVLSITNIDGSPLTITNSKSTSNYSIEIAPPQLILNKQAASTQQQIILVTMALALLLIAVLCIQRAATNQAYRFFASLSLAIIVGLGWWLVFYPAFMSTDSLEQWFQATQHRYGTRHPPLMAMMLHWTQYLDATPATFSCIQSILWWLSIYALLGVLCKTRRAWLAGCILLSLHPVLWHYSVTLWKDIWMTICVLWGFYFLMQFRSTFQRRWYLCAASAFALSLCFRHNAFPFAVIPALEFFINGHLLIGPMRQIARITCSILIFVACLLPSKLLEQLPNTHQETTRLAPQLLVQTLGAYVRLDPTDPGRQQFRKEFDGMFGYGKLNEALEHYDCADWSYLIFPKSSSTAILHRDLIVAEQDFVIRAFKDVLRHYPVQWFQHKLCNFRAFFSGKVGLITHHGIDANAFGFEQVSFFPALKTAVTAITAWFNSSILVQHKCYCLLLLIAMVCAYYQRIPRIILLAVGALGYLVPYLMIDNTPEWRFFLPTDVLALCCICIVLDEFYNRRKQQALL
jgi:hypothetical protein